MVRDPFQTSGNSPTHLGEIYSDFVVENHDSIFLLKPLTPSAISWIEEHIGQDNGYQPLFPTVVVEPRYIADIVEGIQNDDLVCALSILSDPPSNYMRAGLLHSPVFPCPASACSSSCAGICTGGDGEFSPSNHLQRRHTYSHFQKQPQRMGTERPARSR